MNEKTLALLTEEKKCSGRGQRLKHKESQLRLAGSTAQLDTPTVQSTHSENETHFRNANDSPRSEGF